MKKNRKKNKVELLAPAGNFEKLEIAIHYGADAVYLAEKSFSLRSFSANFTPEEMASALDLARAHGVKVYVACNIFPKNADIAPLEDHLRRLGDLSPDAVIVADPGVFSIAKSTIPEIPIHISTQANTTNWRTACFWESMGARRLNTARELTLVEIREIREHCGLEVEAFVHGAMCISYSGRCLLSNFMANRPSNQGMCCHPCRSRYAVMEESRPGQYFPLMEDDRGAYIFNSRDLCMIEHLPEMIQAGVTSLKIEGRMKGIHYVGAVVKVYREALNAYYENPGRYTVKSRWREALARIGHRGYCTGFYYGDPGQTLPNFNATGKQEHRFVGKVLADTQAGTTFFEARNKIFAGDRVEVMPCEGPEVNDRIEKIIDQTGKEVPYAQPQSRVQLVLATQCRTNDLIRRSLDSGTNSPEGG